MVQQLSELSDENSERFRRILEIKIEEVLEQSQTVQEHNLIKKKRDKLKADIAAQTRNLREADGSIKQFIQEDLQNLAEELREAERQLSKLDEGRKNNMIAIRDLEMTKERLLSFAEYAKDAQPEVLVTLIQTIVERIYIVDKDDERYCHIFIKGCSGEDYTGFFQTAGYIEQKLPLCVIQNSIALSTHRKRFLLFLSLCPVCLCSICSLWFFYTKNEPAVFFFCPASVLFCSLGSNEPVGARSPGQLSSRKRS